MLLGVRIFCIVFFSLGMLSHLLLGDNNDQSLRETKEMAKVGEGWSWLLCHLGVFPWGRARFWPGLDGAPSLLTPLPREGTRPNHSAPCRRGGTGGQQRPLPEWGEPPRLLAWPGANSAPCRLCQELYQGQRPGDSCRWVCGSVCLPCCTCTC